MPVLERLNLGVVGAGGRGASFKRVCDAHPAVRLHAVCDVDAGRLEKVAAELGASERYADYEEMLERSEIDAVLLGTPMHYHAPQAIAALERGVHVLSEVPAGVSVEECRRLTAACRQSSARYMMAENYTYRKPNVIVRELVRRNLFGIPYFAEGEYLHELKALNEQTPWRRTWQTGIDGITYGTHSLGPILQWMPGDRVAEVCCAGSGHHYRDPRGDAYEAQDTSVMLCKLRSGGLVKIRVDMLSDRPHAMANYALQGTEGAYESARSAGQADRVWLRSRSSDPNAWTDLAELEPEFLPEPWRTHGAAAAGAGHGGGDYFIILDFVESILGRRQPPIGIDDAMDMTLPGLISQQSIKEAGAWLPVPDSREW